MRGKKRPPEERVSNVTGPLPPCKVCGEPAAGFHYGVNTCEACKGFFRRSLVRKGDYVCQGNGSCPIGANRRKSCPKCRYFRCLEVGMSKEAIKTGRYTYQKRTQDTLEIKRIERVKQETGLEPTQLADIKDPSVLLKNGSSNSSSPSFLSEDSKSSNKSGFPRVTGADDFVGAFDVDSRCRDSSDRFRSSFIRGEFCLSPDEADCPLIPQGKVAAIVKEFNGALCPSQNLHSPPSVKHLTPMTSKFFPSTSSPSVAALPPLPESPLTSSNTSSIPTSPFSLSGFSPERILEQKCPISPINVLPTSGTHCAAQNRHNLPRRLENMAERDTNVTSSFGPAHRNGSTNGEYRTNTKSENENGCRDNIGSNGIFSEAFPQRNNFFSNLTFPIQDTPQMKGEANGHITNGILPYLSNTGNERLHCQSQNILLQTTTHNPHPTSTQAHALLGQNPVQNSAFPNDDNRFGSSYLSELGVCPSPVPGSIHPKTTRTTPSTLPYPAAPHRMFQSQNASNRGLNVHQFPNTLGQQHLPQQHYQKLPRHQAQHGSCQHRGVMRHSAYNGYVDQQRQQDHHQPLRQHWDMVKDSLNQHIDMCLGTSLPLIVNQTSPDISQKVIPISPKVSSESLPGSSFTPIQADTNVSCAASAEDSHVSSSITWSETSCARPASTPGNTQRQGSTDARVKRDSMDMKEIARVLKTPGVTTPLVVPNTIPGKHPPPIQIEVFPRGCTPKAPIWDFAPTSSSSNSIDSKSGQFGNCETRNLSRITRSSNLHSIDCSSQFKRDPSLPQRRFQIGQLPSTSIENGNKVKLSHDGLSHHTGVIIHTNLTNHESSVHRDKEIPTHDDPKHHARTANKENAAHHTPQQREGATSKSGSTNQSPESPKKSPTLKEDPTTGIPPPSDEPLPPLQTWAPVPKRTYSAEEMDEIVSALVGSHRRLIYDTNSLSDEFFASKISECKERCSLQDEIFGHMGVVEREEHQRIYKSTGLDIDNRLESLDHVTELMDSDIRHIIAFLKTIPGFRTFSLPDQTALVKAAMSELFFMAYYRGYFEDHYIVVEASNTYCIHNMATLYPMDFLTKLFGVASAFRALKLSFNATVILKTLTVFSSDRVLLEDRFRCEVLFDKYLQCLLHQLKRDYPTSHGLIMARIAGNMAELRELQHVCYKLWSTEFYQYQAVANKPILMELFTNNY